MFFPLLLNVLFFKLFPLTKEAACKLRNVNPCLGTDSLDFLNTILLVQKQTDQLLGFLRLLGNLTFSFFLPKGFEHMRSAMPFLFTIVGGHLGFMKLQAVSSPKRKALRC